MKILFSLLIITMLHYIPTEAHSIPDTASVFGYYHTSDTTFFVFDEHLYGRSPEKVVVTGRFRGWDTDMEKEQWNLHPISGTWLWMLAVYNPEFAVIHPSSPFKFRIDNGIWLDPPPESPNVEGGNLVFMRGIEPPRLRAEIRGPHAVWALIEGKGVVRPMSRRAYQLFASDGSEITIAEIIPNTASATLIIPEEPLDMRKNYRLEIDELALETWVSHDGWFRLLYSNRELGAGYHETEDLTIFRLFAPRAHNIHLNLYHEEHDTDPYKQVEMIPFPDGTWEADEHGNLEGIYYDFLVSGVEIPGKPDTHKVSDPYARVNADTFGKSRVWEKTSPATPLANGIPKMEDVVAYEVHIQDFTDRLPVSEDLKGTIPAMVVPGLTNSRGEPVGFDYLVDLGVNVVHLMPVQQYFRYPDEIWQRAFASDPHMQEMGISEENYQWGYRTTHAMAIESYYRQRGTEHGAQREQFRNLVQAFHDHGIAVIVDFVFNHTGENMEGLHWDLNFNGIDMLYYYRTNDFKHIGAFGNETKSENRPMVQRWIIDQSKHFIEEFGVDGFRIDLAGQTDEQTLRKLRAELGPEIIIYGEPWIGSNDPDYEANPDWDWYKADSPITFFQDDARNAFKGPVSNPVNPRTDRGYAGGNTAERENAKKGLANLFPEESDPRKGINYLDIHDNWALADRFALNDWDGRKGVDQDAFKIAATLLFTSLGPIVIHGGTEIMRSKGAAPLLEGEVIKETEWGKIYLKGRHDTYNVRVPNQFDWETVGLGPSPDSPNNYAEMHAFWKGLIQFRLSESGKVFRVGHPVSDSYYQWIEPTDPNLLGYVVDQQVAVFLNVGLQARTFESIVLPGKSWKLIANNHSVDHVSGVAGGSVHGGTKFSLVMPPTSLQIYVRDSQ